jgi:hypothetical protein
MPLPRGAEYIAEARLEVAELMEREKWYGLNVLKPV